MKVLSYTVLAALTLASTATSCNYRSIRTAQDITPGNYFNEKLDWRYGAGDIRIQTTKINTILMDRWYARTAYNCQYGTPRIIITDIDNCTDCYISSEMIRDIIESAAIDDGRYTVVVGNGCDECELDALMNKNLFHPKYSNSSQLLPGKALAPQFLAKIRLTKAVSSDNWYDYEDYRMTVTLYDIETQVAIDSAWDVLRKQVCR